MSADLLQACHDLSSTGGSAEEMFLLVAKASNNRLLCTNRCGGIGAHENDRYGVCSNNNAVIERIDFQKMFRELRKTLIMCTKSCHAASGGFPAAQDTSSTNLRLKLCVLCAGIESATRLSPPEVLGDGIEDSREDVIYCLPKLLQITFNWKEENNDTMRLSALSSVVAILSRVAEHLPGHSATFGISLLNGLKGGNHSVPMDIKVDATCTLVGLLRIKGDPEQRAIVLSQIYAHSGLILSLLSTASMSVQANSQLKSTLSALLLMGQGSHSLRKALVKRRSTVLAICKHLGGKDADACLIALSLCMFIFESKVHAGESNLLESNSTRAANGLVQLLGQASTETTTLLEALQVSVAAVHAPMLGTASKDDLMHVMMLLAKDSARPTEVNVKAALSYLQCTSRAETRMEVLSNAVGFLSNPPSRAVRRAALLLLRDISYWNPRALLSDSLGCLNMLAEIISRALDDDCSIALQISLQVAGESGTTSILCRNERLVLSVVQLVTTEPILNRSAFINGVYVLIAFMSEDKNVSAFLDFPELLPWLIDLANRTTDDDMKQQLVSVIVRYTVAKLGEIATTATAS